ncbi:unnamed protein product [Schistocephalus solidus]|uniref:TPR_REGION domain-containing protein n=1 Tax=Schistocephalus solidus TaxID=70667 RepID=A0A183SXV8_SCHSO|nr:unnamed protein product [Schistocephalus solidus]
MAEATIRALTDKEPMTERTPAIEIIDLPPIPAISSTSTGTLDDEALYSKFLSGNMAFEDLMKELHMKTSAPLTAAKEEKPARRRGKRQKPRLPLASDFESEKEEAGGFQFEPPPDASAPFVVLADMYFRQGRREDSRENLLQATERNPKDGPTWMRLADFAEEDGDLKSAITFARNAIRVAPEDEDFRSRLMELLTASGKDKEALRVKLTALLTSKNPDIQRVYQEILDIAEVSSFV